MKYAILKCISVLVLATKRTLNYDALETPTQTPTLATSEAKVFASQKIDMQIPEKEDLGAATDQLQSEKEPESGQLVGQ